MFTQFVVTPMSQLPPASPSQRGRLTPVIFKSTELFAVLLTNAAVTAVGRVPRTKVGEPLKVPYLISGNWPTNGTVSATLMVIVPEAVQVPITFTGALVGLPKVPRSKLRADGPVTERVAALNWPLADCTIVPKPAPLATV